MIMKAYPEHREFFLVKILFIYISTIESFKGLKELKWTTHKIFHLKKKKRLPW